VKQGELGPDEQPALKPISVSDVDSELATTWRTFSATRGDGMPMRSCTMNLLTLVPDPAQSVDASAVIARLAASHPIRAITIVQDNESPDDAVRAWVGIDCAAGPPGAANCGAEIMLRAHPDSGERVVSAVRGLLAADLPVIVWWRGGPPLRAPLFRSIGGFADKIIVDSVRFGDGEAGLDTLRRLIEYVNRATAIADLNWARVAPWRLTLAACFDHADVLALLPQLDRCSVEFAASPLRTTPPSARALLLGGWIVSRLPRLAGRIRLIPKPDPGRQSGLVLGIAFSSSRSRAQLGLRWAQAGADMSAVALDAAGNEVRRWNAQREAPGEAELLHDCIDQAGSDPLLEAALA